MIKSSVTYGVLSLVLFVFSLSHYNIDVVSSGDGVISITDSNINITSPISGEIQSLNVSQGDSVDIGEKMISIKNIEDKHNLELMKERREIYKIKSDYLKYERELLGNIFLSGTFHLDENNPSGEDVLGNSLLIGVEKTISARLLRLREQYRFYLSRKLFFEKNKKTLEEKKINIESQKKLSNEKVEVLEKSLGRTTRVIDAILSQKSVDLDNINNSLSLIESENDMLLEYSKFTQMTVDFISENIEEAKMLELEMAKNKSDLNILYDRIKSTNIKSTISGSILSLETGLYPGVYVEKNAKIMTIKRKDHGVYIDGRFSSKLRPFFDINSEVKVRIDAPGIKRHFYGKITNVSVDSFVDDKDETRYYSVKIKFNDENDVRNILHKMVGVKASIHVINDSMSFLSYITSVFNKDLDFSVW